MAVADATSAVAATTAAEESAAALPPNESRALTRLRAKMDPQLNVTTEMLLDLATKVDAEAERGSATAPGDAAEMRLAFQMDLAEAVVTLSVAGSRAEEALDLVYEPFFDCRFFPGENHRPWVGDEMGADVHHAAIGCALVRAVNFGRDHHQFGPDVTELLRGTNRGSRYRPLRTVWSSVSSTFLLFHDGSPTLIVACRPTKKSHARDWIYNLSTALVRPPPALGLPLPAPADAGGPVDGVEPLVHEGFGLAAAALKDEVFGAISAWREERLRGQPSADCRVVFTGHSLGAAVATLLALAYGLAADGEAPPTLVTFGGPRLGNAALDGAVAAHTAHTRVVVSGDKVAGWPSSSGYVAASANLHWQLDETPPRVLRRGLDAKPVGARSVKFFHAFLTKHPFVRYMHILVQHYQELVPAGGPGWA